MFFNVHTAACTRSRTVTLHLATTRPAPSADVQLCTSKSAGVSKTDALYATGRQAVGLCDSSVVAKSPSRSARRWTGAAAPVHADAARRRRSVRARLCASWQRSLAWGCRAHRDNRVTALASMSSLNSYRAGEADRCAVGSSDLEATPSIIIAQRACPAESEPVHPSQASSYWHDVVDVEPDPDQETEDDTTAVIATRSPVGYWRQFVIATLANCAQTERCRSHTFCMRLMYDS